MFHYLQKKQRYCLRIKTFQIQQTCLHKHRRPEKATWKPKLFTSQFSESFRKDSHSNTNGNAGLDGQMLTVSLTG